MSFRLRVTLLVAAAIALTVSAASIAVWVTARHELVSQVDSNLKREEPHGPFVLAVTSEGEIQGGLAGIVPVTSSLRKLARSGGEAYYANVTIQGQHVREYARAVQGGAILTIAPLDATDRALRRIKFWAFLISGLGIAAGAALAAVVAGAALRPVRRLTAAAETVAATGDLTERVEASSSDELGRLATRFNAMLAALEESVGRQRRLVADASHELRTPLTAARANVDLVREGKLPEEEVRHALDEASVELDSLTSLVSDLVELARGEERKLRLEDVALDDLVSSAVERAKARAPEATFVMSLTPVHVRVDPVLVERAVGNLLDNAVKYSPPGAPIEVSVRDGEVTVADRGPGIAEEDLQRIFDRFYRAATARAKPGAGLGLAIVREAAEAHGGQATAESSASGAKFRLMLPATA
ncbi:MAG TPA: HAMP domain-containing sensor histidine kinase [Gaiellaceae bacterium]|nr:HAMP domain-containing sensor histidine kinase [Gaiellaceae bacterium]